MRIKIHTYNFTSNYGAILQAFSLGYYLNSFSDLGVTFNASISKPDDLLKARMAKTAPRIKKITEIAKHI